jgi:hypothetical protein
MADIKAVQSRQGTSTDLKASLINEIVPLFGNPDVTPAVILDGKWSTQFVGRVYAAEMVHTSGIDPRKLNVSFIAKHHLLIVPQSSVVEMEGELARVQAIVKATEIALADANAQSGEALGAAVADLSTDFDKMSEKALLIGSQNNDAVIFAFKAKVDAFVADYLAATQQESALINA